MSIKKAEIRLLFTNGKEAVISVEYEEGDERLEPLYYLGGVDTEKNAENNHCLRAGNRGKR